MTPDNLTPEEKVIFERYIGRQKKAFPIGFFVGGGIGGFISVRVFQRPSLRFISTISLTLAGLGSAYVWATRKFMQEILELDNSPLANQLVGLLQARGLVNQSDASMANVPSSVPSSVGSVNVLKTRVQNDDNKKN